MDRPHNSDGPYAAVAGNEKPESAVDEKARGHGGQHVRARGLALEGFERPAEAMGLARVGLVRGQGHESPGHADGEGASGSRHDPRE